LYSPPERAETARHAQQAWAAFRDIGRSLAELNRAQLWFAPYMTGQPVVPAEAAEGRKWIVEFRYPSF
jgi:hypothetical protein